MNKYTRFAYWMSVLSRYGSGLIRLALFVAGVYFLFEGPWSNGVGGLAILFFWKLNMLQDRLGSIRDSLRGFSDDDAYEALRTGDATALNPKGLLQEIATILRDIRNNQMKARSDGGTF
jgi:hypothetical protein